MYGHQKYAFGLYPKLIQKIFDRLNQPIEIKALPWKRALKTMDKESIGIAGIYKNKQRIQRYDYSQPFYDESLLIYVRKGQEFEFWDLDDLAGKTIGLNSGWSYGEKIDLAVKNGIFKGEEALNNMLNFRKLVRARVDGIIVDKVAALIVIDNENISDKVVQLKIPVSINPVYTAFPKKTNKKGLINAINYELSNMKADGTFKTIINEYIQNASERNSISTNSYQQ